MICQRLNLADGGRRRRRRHAALSLSHCDAYIDAHSTEEPQGGVFLYYLILLEMECAVFGIELQIEVRRGHARRHEHRAILVRQHVQMMRPPKGRAVQRTLMRRGRKGVHRRRGRMPYTGRHRRRSRKGGGGRRSCCSNSSGSSSGRRCLHGRSWRELRGGGGRARRGGCVKQAR